MRINDKQFEWKEFSTKQMKVMTWWNDDSPYKDYNGIIGDGAVRSGKTISMAPSFILWAMTKYNDCDFAICGKTVGSVRRNVINNLGKQVQSLGMSFLYKRSDNYIIICNGEHTNYFYVFGGRDESSQDLIQGMTLAGVLFDEVALMPQSFVKQAEARCSVEGAKFWYNCNPKSPAHWFYQEYIKDKAYEHKKLLYLHFLMEDNLTLSEETKERYKNNFVGVFFKRNILGLWVTAEGQIYNSFSKDNIINIQEWNETNINGMYTHKIRSKLFLYMIGVDFGGNGSATTFQLTGMDRNYQVLVTLKEKRITEPIDPEKLNKMFVEFVKECLIEYSNIIEIRCDSAEQVLIRGLKNALMKEHIAIPIKNAIKGEIIDRIRFYQYLFAVKKYFILSNCTITVDAFENAVWEDGKEDVRLDDGTTNIDTLDAQEYSTEKVMPIMMKLDTV